MTFALAQLRLSFLTAIQYRMDYVLTAVSVIISASVELALWRLVMQERGEVQGYNLHTLLVYLILANIVSMLRVNWNSAFEFSEEIRSGKVTRHLLKPASLYSIFTCHWLAGKIPVFIGGFIVFSSLLVLFPETFHPGFLQWFLFLIWLVVSLWISSEIYFSLILTAFWVAENIGVIVAFNIMGWGLVGIAFPISFYPEWAQRILDFTPFPYFVYYPVQTLMARISFEASLTKLFYAISIGIFFHFVRRISWKFSEQRLQTVGG